MLPCSRTWLAIDLFTYQSKFIHIDLARVHAAQEDSAQDQADAAALQQEVAVLQQSNQDLKRELRALQAQQGADAVSNGVGALHPHTESSNGTQQVRCAWLRTSHLNLYDQWDARHR